MRSICFFLVSVVMLSLVHAQPWYYDFGSGTGNHTSGISTTFLPAPSVGSARVRVGTGGGSFNLQNPGLGSLGSESELRITAPTNTSVNKFSIYNYPSGTESYVRFDMLLGSSTGGSTTPGNFYLFIGDGLSFYDNNAFDGSQVFTGLQWRLQSNGAVSTYHRNGGSWVNLVNPAPFSQSTVYTIEVFANNSTITSSYFKSGAEYFVGVNKQDIWINGLLFGDEYTKGQLPDNSSIDYFMFYGESSTGNVANCFLDNIIYSNELPRIVAPTTQASDISFSNVLHDQIEISWTSGNGSARIVMMNTTNTFTDPISGYNPVADSEYDSNGEQVVYNGDGDNLIVTGLSPLTTYWFRVYEYNGYGSGTKYNTNTASDNPNSRQTTQDQELPVILTSFTTTHDPFNRVLLTWVTQSETGMLGYYVLRGGDNNLALAEQISTLIPATNSSQQQSYVFTDADPGPPGNYYYWLQSADLDGSSGFHGPQVALHEPWGQPSTPSIPLKTGLHGVFPNPFNPHTFISYSLAKTSDVRFQIHNSRGQLVRHLDLGTLESGAHRLVWDGKDDQGRDLGSGIYYISMRAGHESFRRKAVLLK